MEKIGIKIVMDNFLTQPRLRGCAAVTCRFNSVATGEDFTCDFKVIDVDEHGCCRFYEQSPGSIA